MQVFRHIILKSNLYICKMADKNNPPFKRGDVVYFNSSSEVLLTVQHCIFNEQEDNEWWLYTFYWDKKAKTQHPFNNYASMFTKYEPSQNDEEEDEYTPPGFRS